MIKFKFAAIGLLLFLTSSPLDAVENPNVLVIFMDDLRPELGCYGHEHIKSPNIDTLAADGVLFERAYCQQGICAPSRASMLAGQYPDSLGIYDLWSPLRRTVPDVISMPRYFMDRGYVTSSFGKVYHHHVDDKKYWTHLPDVPGEKWADAETLADIARRTKAAKDEGLTGMERFHATQGPAIESADVQDDAYRDGTVATQAIKALRERKDKPFFMCVGFAKPHLPFAAPKRYWDLYQQDQFAVPQRDLPTDAPKFAFTNWGELRAYQGIPKQGPLSDELTQELTHGYAACVSYADAQVGRVMEELDRQGLRENTIVVLWGDHGYKLGDYGLWCKHTNLELDARVPFIVSAPGFDKGTRSPALVEMVDIFPTLVKLTGGDIPSSCDGKSLIPVLQTPTKTIRDFALSQYPRGLTMGYSMRTDRWRYTEWINSETKKIVGRELYDHQTTQRPAASVVGNPEHSKIASELSKKLDAPGRLAKVLAKDEDALVNRKRSE
jgi:iduronate 2-sulfatase